MVRYEVNGVRATLTIDEPERRNPMSVETMSRLAEGTERAMADDSVRVLVVTGAGDKAFSAGGDLSSGFVDDPVGLHRHRGVLADLFRAMRRGGKPTIGRINGHALAGGFGLAVACDIGVCVEDAKLGAPEINVGLWPMMISAILASAMPRKAALELMMTGRIISPQEALEVGAISRVVPRHLLDSTVDEIVDLLASKSPVALSIGKRSFYSVSDPGFDAALDRLQGGLTAISLTEDSREGVVAFVEKREPRWSGR